MFDYQTSKHAHFDAACRAFALSHNLEDVAAAVGMRPQILRNKLNPIQPHRLTCDELLAIYADVAIHSHRLFCAGMYWHGGGRHDQQTAFRNGCQNTQLASRVSHEGTVSATRSPVG